MEKLFKCVSLHRTKLLDVKVFFKFFFLKFLKVLKILKVLKVFVYHADTLLTSRKTKQAVGGFRLLLVFTFYGLYFISLLIALRYHRALSESTDLSYTISQMQ